MGLFFERGAFSPEDAANTVRFLRPMIFMLILLVPAYLQNNTIAAWLKMKESFPYALISSLSMMAAFWFLIPK